jgi:hypothetical protein
MSSAQKPSPEPRSSIRFGILPPDAKLPDGTEVKVEPLELLPETDPAIAAVLKLATRRPHWPKDYALNHAHYVKGHPRKAA